MAGRRSTVATAALLLLCTLAPGIAAAAAGEADKGDSGVMSLESDDLDVRDILLATAVKARRSIVVSPSVSGSLALSIKKRSADDCMKIVATVAGLDILECGSVLVFSRTRNLPRPELPPSLQVDRKAKDRERTVRKARLRSELLGLSRKLSIPVIIGEKVVGFCPIHSEKASLADLLEALAWAGGVNWTLVDGVLFIGSPEETRRLDATAGDTGPSAPGR